MESVRKRDGRSLDHRVRLFFVGGPISLSGGGEAGGIEPMQAVVTAPLDFIARSPPAGDATSSASYSASTGRWGSGPRLPARKDDA